VNGKAMFINADHPGTTGLGNNRITFKGLVVRGRRNEALSSVPADQREEVNCVLFKLDCDEDRYCQYIRVENLLVTEWPGTVHRGHRLRDFHWLNNEIKNAHRGA
jgi:hypothetical protein